MQVNEFLNVRKQNTQVPFSPGPLDSADSLFTREFTFAKITLSNDPTVGIYPNGGPRPSSTPILSPS